MTWPNLGWAKKKDDTPWLDCMDGFKMAKEVYPDGDSIESFPQVTRVEVISKKGREFVQYDCSDVQVSMQDDGQTLKVFLS